MSEGVDEAAGLFLTEIAVRQSRPRAINRSQFVETRSAPSPVFTPLEVEGEF